MLLGDNGVEFQHRAICCHGVLELVRGVCRQIRWHVAPVATLVLGATRLRPAQTVGPSRCVCYVAVLLHSPNMWVRGPSGHMLSSGSIRERSHVPTWHKESPRPLQHQELLCIVPVSARRPWELIEVKRAGAHCHELHNLRDNDTTPSQLRATPCTRTVNTRRYNGIHWGIGAGARTGKRQAMTPTTGKTWIRTMVNSGLQGIYN